MAEFVGGVGAAFIMAAVAALIVKFLVDINIIKNRENVLLYGKVAISAIAVGIVYISVAVFMYNVAKGQTNFFALGEIFSSFGVEKSLRMAEEPSAAGMFGGLMMPLYPCLAHIFGKLAFDQYVLTAQFISFAAACVSACLLYAWIGKYNESPTELVLLAASLPFAFMLFMPSYTSLTIMFLAMALYSLSRDNLKLFVAAGILACLTCKLGFVAFLFYPLKDKFPKFIKAAQPKNRAAYKIILTVLILYNGAALYWLIRGV
ncbi:MAG: hypothetical protein IJH37_04905 [Clostridia bacterium]|nr:hypothetical protein [Clostridia bacterium]